MLDVILRTKKSTLAGALLALGVVLGASGWAVTSQRVASAAVAERDAATAELQRYKEASGQLEQIETRLGSARFEYAKVVQNWADVRSKMGSAQQELAAITRRVDQAKDRAAQSTGSIRAAEPPKRPAPAKP